LSSGESGSSGSNASNQLQLNVKGPSELKLQITIDADKTVKDLKEAIAKSSDVEAERQRLIYSGRVLKDEDKLSVYKIQSGNTLHMVKGVAKSSNAQSSGSTPQRLPTMQAGQDPSDPLTQLNSHLAHGAIAGLNPFAELGLNANDPNMAANFFESPQVMEQMSRVMSDPAMVEMLISRNPSMAPMANQIRQAMADPQFRAALANPDSLRSMMRTASMMQSAGFGADAMGPMGLLFGGLPPPPGQGQNANQAGGQGSNPAPPTHGGNPFGMVDPDMLQQMMGGYGGLPAALGGAGNPSAANPTNSRPPEERYEQQLTQLREMGFVNTTQNVRALVATGGNVQMAIEYILGGGGL